MTLHELFVKAFPRVDGYFRCNASRRLCDLYGDLLAQGAVPDIAFLKAARGVASRLYGPESAALCARELQKGGAVFAAGHCGFENHPQLIASTLCALSAKGARGRTGAPAVHVALCCSNITPSNGSVPCGLLTGRLDARRRRIKVNLAPSRLSSSYLDGIDAFGADDFARASGRAAGSFNAREIRALRNLCRLCAHSGASGSLAQAAIVNTRAYGRLFPGAMAMFLPIEEIASCLVISDLRAGRGVLSGIMSDRAALEQLLSDLCGVRGCWSRELLFDEDADVSGHQHRGSVLFYGYGANSHHRTLKILRREGGMILCGKGIEVPLKPSAVAAALESGALRLSLFSCYMPLLLDHGVRLSGGVFMSDYLVAMANAMARALGLSLGWRGESPISSCAMPFWIREDEAGLNCAHPLSFADLLAMDDPGPLYWEEAMQRPLSDFAGPTECEMMVNFASGDLGEGIWDEIAKTRSRAAATAGPGGLCRLWALD